MDDATRTAVAAALLKAQQHRKPIDPITQTHPGLTVGDAYAVQLEQVRVRTGEGRRVQGHKVGLTSAAMRRQLNVDQPDFGHLLDDMFHLDGLPIDVDGFISPRAEPEIAFVLKRPLTGPGINVAQALSAVDYVLPAIEIIDSRIRDWKIGLVDTVADNASSGGVVLGSRPSRVDAVDLRLSGCMLTRRGAVVGTGAGGAVLGSPVTALVWLANTVGRYGVGLDAGHVILPGAVSAAVPVAAGDVVTATFHGLGSVSARFVQERR
jgi:2-keto-4-pentenoate hydratase